MENGAVEVSVGCREPKPMAQRRRRCDAMQTFSGRFSVSDRIIPYGNTPSFAYLQNKTAFGASK